MPREYISMSLWRARPYPPHSRPRDPRVIPEKLIAPRATTWQMWRARERQQSRDLSTAILDSPLIIVRYARNGDTSTREINIIGRQKLIFLLQSHEHQHPRDHWKYCRYRRKSDFLRASGDRVPHRFHRIWLFLLRYD